MDELPLSEQAKTCEGCLGWLKNCKAQCCYWMIATRKNVLESRRGWYVKGIMTDDFKNYYTLHDCKVFNEVFFVPKRGTMTTTQGNIIIFKRRCTALTEDDLCSLHGTDRKPRICQEFDENGPMVQGNGFAPPLCLARYRNR